MAISHAPPIAMMMPQMSMIAPSSGAARRESNDRTFVIRHLDGLNAVQPIFSANLPVADITCRTSA
ncbi:hypothetical protein [Bradyrhizobium sp. WSM471]|uniref:hypothetical protein n=1 Tax=Bradyrhizobium sp. WSM471 TaxID=319017 RepID=UPI0002E4DE84|nr:MULTISPECIES: hypothetical protein [Bradyrhizobium]UFW43760.1 hypothetical protein BcanWSM471_12090 [Bradyrhizobium canariense]